MKEASVIILVADGLRPDALEAAIARGDVPELAALRDAGGRRTVTTVFPSVTGVAYIPVLTGWHPAPAGVPGLRWFDRDRQLPALLGHARSYVGLQLRRIDDDLAPGARTLFEHARGMSLGSMAMVTRGLPPPARLDRGWRFTVRAMQAHVAGDVAAWAALEANLAERLVDRVRREQPRFVFASFTAGDKGTHADGAGSPHALRSLRMVDHVARQLRLDAERDGRWPGMRLWVASDHGHSPVSHHAELADLVRATGVRVRAHPWTVPDRAEVAVMVSGNSMAHVYLDLESRPRRPWPDLAPRWRERLAFLWSHPAIDLVAVKRSATTVEVWKGGSNAIIEADGARYSYRTLSGDPLGCGPFEGLCGMAAHERCAGGGYPDAIVQLAALVLAGRSGDMVVSAAPGWDLRGRFEPVAHRSSHGALHGEHMLVPLLGNRPPTGELRRTADLFRECTRTLGVAAGPRGC